MMGFAGQLSLGHALYVGLGAYTAAALFAKYGVSPWLGMLAGTAFAGLAGSLIALLSFRFGVGGVYFALLTIAFNEFTRVLFDHFGFVGGSSGLFLHVANRAGDDFLNLRGSPQMFYYLLLALTLGGHAFQPRDIAPAPRLLLARDPRGRGGGARLRDRSLALQARRGRSFGRAHRDRRHRPRLLRQQPLPRHGVRDLALGRDHHRADRGRPRHLDRSAGRRLHPDLARRDHDGAFRLLRAAGPQAVVLRRGAARDRDAAAIRRLALDPRPARPRDEGRDEPSLCSRSTASRSAFAASRPWTR